MNNNAGSTIEALGGTLTIKTHSAINNAGTLEAATGATLRIDVGTINNTGNIQIDGTFEVNNPSAFGEHLTFNDSGTVTLAGGNIVGGPNAGGAGFPTRTGSSLAIDRPSAQRFAWICLRIDACAAYKGARDSKVTNRRLP